MTSAISRVSRAEKHERTSVAAATAGRKAGAIVAIAAAIWVSATAVAITSGVARPARPSTHLAHQVIRPASVRLDVSISHANSKNTAIMFD